MMIKMNNRSFQNNQPPEQVYEKTSDKNSMNNIGMMNYNMMYSRMNSMNSDNMPNYNHNMMYGEMNNYNMQMI